MRQIVLLASICAVGFSKKPFTTPYVAPVYNSHTSCGSSMIYDSTAEVCVSCGTNQIVDQSITDAFGNFINCKCQVGYLKTSADCSAVLRSFDFVILLNSFDVDMHLGFIRELPRFQLFLLSFIWKSCLLWQFCLCILWFKHIWVEWRRLFMQFLQFGVDWEGCFREQTVFQRMRFLSF